MRLDLFERFAVVELRRSEATHEDGVKTLHGCALPALGTGCKKTRARRITQRAHKILSPSQISPTDVLKCQRAPAPGTEMRTQRDGLEELLWGECVSTTCEQHGSNSPCGHAYGRLHSRSLLALSNGYVEVQ